MTLVSTMGSNAVLQRNCQILFVTSYGNSHKAGLLWSKIW